MGKGDIKSRRGKLFAGSFGKRRPAKKARKAALKYKSAKEEKPVENAPYKAPKTVVEEVKQPQKKIEVQEKEVKAAEASPKKEKAVTKPQKKSVSKEKQAKAPEESPADEKPAGTELQEKE